MLVRSGGATKFGEGRSPVFVFFLVTFSNRRDYADKQSSESTFYFWRAAGVRAVAVRLSLVLFKLGFGGCGCRNQMSARFAQNLAFKLAVVAFKGFGSNHSKV